MGPRVTLAAVAVLAACRDAPPGERELRRALGDEVDLVVVVEPRSVAGTWAERAAYTLAPAVPACVRERARRASAVAVTWDQSATDVTAGRWSLVLIGGGATAAAPACDGLERGDGIAWYGADPRGGTARFFADPEREARWRALGRAPVRAIANAQVQLGIAVRGAATLDPRDGVAAHVKVRFAERAAATGAMEMLVRARRELDRERLGGAWPAFQWDVAVDPSDPLGASLAGELVIPGARGEEAMLFAAVAIAGGGPSTPGAPCHAIADEWAADIHCAQGRYTVSPDLMRRILDEPERLERAARVVLTYQNGVPAGFKLYSIRPGGVLYALGLENGDRVHTIAGVTITTLDAVRQMPSVLRGAERFEVELERHGREVVLRYHVR